MAGGAPARIYFFYFDFVVKAMLFSTEFPMPALRSRSLFFFLLESDVSPAFLTPFFPLWILFSQ